MITITIFTYGKRWKRCEEEVEEHEVHLVDHHLTGEATVQLEPENQINILCNNAKFSYIGRQVYVSRNMTCSSFIVHRRHWPKADKDERSIFVEEVQNLKNRGLSQKDVVSNEETRMMMNWKMNDMVSVQNEYNLLKTILASLS